MDAIVLEREVRDFFENNRVYLKIGFLIKKRYG